jgi:hypothetical protein
MGSVNTSQFQQDSTDLTPAVPYFSFGFVDRVLSNAYSGLLQEKLLWQSFLPDLNPCDYILWGFEGQIVSRNLPTDQELKSAILSEFNVSLLQL